MTNAVKVEMNQPVVMADGYRRGPDRGTVVKVGRVWIEILPEGWPAGRTRRFRLDTQTDGSEIGTPARFYTLDQWAERERRVEADRFLREQGIRIETGSRWHGREVELASLLRKAVSTGEDS